GILRPRAAARSAGRYAAGGRRPVPEPEAPGLPGSRDCDGAVRSEEDRAGRTIRALLDPEDDRVALGPRADGAARPLREEPGGGSRLHETAGGDCVACIHRAAGDGLLN